MGFFSKARDMYALQRQAKTVKKELKNLHIEAAVEGVTVTVNGEQDILSVVVSEEKWKELTAHDFGKKRLEEVIIKALNKALKKSQEIAGTKMKGVWQQLGVEAK